MPTEDNIEWAVRRLNANRYRGPSGMKVDHLRQWLRGSRNMEEAVSMTEEEAG